MLQERYNFEAKEKILSAVARNDFCEEKFFPLIVQEAYAISRRETQLDLLGVTPWNKVSGFARLLLKSIENLRPGEDYYDIPADTFNRENSEHVKNWERDITFDLNRTDTTEKIRAKLLNSRALISSVSGLENMRSICGTLLLCDQAGILPARNNTLFLQFPGSFNPFPHCGHIEIVSIAVRNIQNNESHVVITTFAKNHYRQDANSMPFLVKINLLQRGFAFVPNTIVLGMASNTERQLEQMKIVSSLSQDGKIHYICGDDAFVAKVRQAKSGDTVAIELFVNGLIFYVSQRYGQDSGELKASLKYAERMGSKVILLPAQTYALSGSEMRKKIANGKLEEADFPNTHVKEFFRSLTSYSDGFSVS